MWATLGSTLVGEDHGRVGNVEATTGWWQQRSPTMGSATGAQR